MPTLKCDVKNCSYNESNYCSLDYIHVGKKSATNREGTQCESFNEQEYVASNCAKEPEEVVQIKCSALPCIYNDNVACKCMAENVAISSTTTACTNCEDTLCGAFISR